MFVAEFVAIKQGMEALQGLAMIQTINDWFPLLMLAHDDGYKRFRVPSSMFD
jgi:hypothetical protein